MILAKIDVTKIDKSRLFKGEKGTYLDICLVETPNSQYDQDYMVTQSISKADREAGQRGAILGNARIVGAKPAAQAPKPVPAPAQENLDDIPF